MNFFEVTFWTSLALVFYTFAGYPLLLWLLAAARSPFLLSAFCFPNFFPSVSMVLCVHNEETRIIPRLQNLLDTDYPAEKLDIVVVSDGSSDQTVDRVTEFIGSGAGRQVELVSQPRRAGKARGVNLAVAKGTGNLVVFADARQSFAKDTIPQLVARFGDARVGAVSGALEIERAGTNAGAGVDAYWRLEKFIRRTESVLGASIGCTGAVYAIRRELFRPLPEDTILDDVVIPMQVLSQGYRVEFEARAVALDPQSLEPERELIRKRRTLAGNYQMLFRYPGWLAPWRNRAWWQLVSHKYLRLAAPWLLLCTLATNVALVNHALLYRWTLVGQAGLYLLAVCGLCFGRLRFKPFSIPAGFVFLNSMAVVGLFHYLCRGTEGAGWGGGKRLTTK
jgi:cellulose synthase/poly-beta-1,6-N-acetylglucosamine synthase-like glycosyltransferase